MPNHLFPPEIIDGAMEGQALHQILLSVTMKTYGYLISEDVYCSMIEVRSADRIQGGS